MCATALCKILSGYIELGDNCIQICHSGRCLSSDIWSEILFYGDASAEP